MMRFLLRHGAVRLIGGRAIPALWLFDAAMLANRVRKVPVVDRNLRRGAGAVQRKASSTMTGRPGRPSRGARPTDESPPHEQYSPPPR